MKARSKKLDRSRTSLALIEAASHPVIIVGAGPAGLAMGTRLKRAGIPFRILERSSELGHSWKNHYDRLCLHTASSESYLPFKPFPRDWPEFVPRELFVTYLEEYAKEFGLPIECQIEVERIDWVRDHFSLRTNQGDQLASKVVMATGFCNQPIIPDLPGLKEFEGEVLMAGKYSNVNHPIDLKGKKVLVLGMGNTGAEIALDLAENGIDVSLSVRSPINVVRRDIFGRPTQKTSILLAKLPSVIGFPLAKVLQRLTVGSLRGTGLQFSGKSPLEQLFMEGKTPVIDLGTIEAIRNGSIHVYPGVSSISGRGFLFSDGRTASFDVMLIATGYRNALEDMIPHLPPRFYELQPNVPWILPDLPGIYFLGFDARYNGQLRAIRLQSELIANAIIA